MQPLSHPLLTLTRTASATLSANRFVTYAGAVPAADANVLGVVRQAAASGDAIPVDVLGVTLLEAGAAVTAGDTLKTDNQGRGIPWATAGARLAIALSGASGAGELLEVLLLPNAA